MYSQISCCCISSQDIYQKTVGISANHRYSAAWKFVNPLSSLDVSVVLPWFSYFIITSFHTWNVRFMCHFWFPVSWRQHRSFWRPPSSEVFQIYGRVGSHSKKATFVKCQLQEKLLPLNKCGLLLCQSKRGSRRPKCYHLSYGEYSIMVPCLSVCTAGADEWPPPGTATC